MPCLQSVQGKYMEKTGMVFLVGAGPGDPELLTIKGKRIIEQADCIIYDRLASPQLLSLAKKECELIYAGKADHRHTLPQEEINRLLAEKARQYDVVVRLKGGDVYVFGRGGEEGIALREQGIRFEVVPGISSAIAGPAYAGIPITHRGVAAGFHVVTAHSREDRLSEIDFSSMKDEGETCVFLMGLKHVGEVARGLMDAGRKGDTPAAVISHATTPEQRCCVGTLEDIADKTERAGLTSPAIIVVGDVVSLRGQLNCMEERPLSSKKYFVPVILSQDTERTTLAEFLRRLGAEVWEQPVGEIVFCPPGEPLDKFPDWMIFTSRNGVDAFFWLLKQQNKDARALSGTKIAAIGGHTKERLAHFGLIADLVPKEANSEAFVREFSPLLKKDDRVWYIRAKQAGKVIGEKLSFVCDLTEIAVYENRKLSIEGQTREKLIEELSGSDGIFFTSASSAERIRSVTDILPPEIYSIGPKCTAKLTKSGITGVRQSKEPSYESLAELAKESRFLL